jgi:predicted RNA binding protein YcfA (HicA-like mRNA interferase family)
VAKFPVDAPADRVIKALEKLGFQIIREGNHIAMSRINPDGSRTPLTMPNHRTIKGPTLRTILTQSGISRDDFLDSYEDPD